MAFSFNQFADLGLLWLINRSVFHPRGLTISFEYAEGEAEPRGWGIRAFDQPPVFSDDTEERHWFKTVESLLANVRENPDHYYPDSIRTES